MKRTFLKSLLALALSASLAAVAQETKTSTTAKVKVTIETSKGTLELELDGEKAPISVKNFVEYAKGGFYEGTVFHRCIPGFMIQGGGMTADMSPKKGDKPAIQNEAKNGLKNARGTIAMARTGEPHSATSQFFINVKNNTSLDYPSFDGWGYAVFGTVTKGMDVADAIVSVPTTKKGPHADVPVDPITITKVTVTEAK